MSLRAWFTIILLFCCAAARAEKCASDTANAFVSRVIAVQSEGGRIYGAHKAEGGAAFASPFELNDKEVVLVFSGGPHSAYTGYILDNLDKYCVKAVFFFGADAAGEHSKAVREALQHGQTVGVTLGSGKVDDAPVKKAERAFAAVAKAASAPTAPFLRVAPSALSREMQDYLVERGIAVFSADYEAGAADGGSVSKYANTVLEKVQAMKKGVIEFRDTQKVTVDALDSILLGLKNSGFKVVQVLAFAPLAPKDGAAVAGEPSAKSAEDTQPASKKAVTRSAESAAIRRREAEIRARRRAAAREAEAAERRREAEVNQRRRAAAARAAENRRREAEGSPRRRAAEDQ